MMQLSSAIQSFGTWLARHRVELGLSLRVTISALATLAASEMLHLRIPLWAVLTAVILTQLSVGRSLRATFDYFAGTVGAAIYAGGVGLVFPVTNDIALFSGVAIAVAPATLLATLNARFSAAPFTAVLVFLAPTITNVTPIESALERVFEVAVGGSIGLIVSLLVLPARAHVLAINTAAHMLELMARFQSGMFASFSEPPDRAKLLHLQDSIGKTLVCLETIALEARQERAVRLTPEPDQGPLVRTMLRLRHDLVMIWRATLEPLPEPFKARLGPRLTQIGTATTDYLNGCARALLTRRGPPPVDTVLAALDGYAGEMSALRQEGLTRVLPVHAAEHIFALGFALDQMRHHFHDLARSVTEHSVESQRNALRSG